MITFPQITAPRPALPSDGVERRDLHTGWTVRAVAGPVAANVAGQVVPAQVPGCVHTDLLAADLIDDPYLDDNENLVAWVGRCDWEYRTTFAWSAGEHERHDLVFEGLDTVATVTLNGTEVARTANQHRSYRFDVSEILREGDNELVVHFASPIRYADAQSLELGYRPQVNHHPFNAMRKVACNFGWDWGIDAATVGLWRPVRLESWSTARLAGVRAVASAQEPVAGERPTTGILAVHATIERSGVGGDDTPLAVSVRLSGHGVDLVETVALASSSHAETDSTGELSPNSSGSTLASNSTGSVSRRSTNTAGNVSSVTESVEVRVEAPDVALWWPRGYGKQPLYDVEVTLVRQPNDPTSIDGHNTSGDPRPADDSTEAAAGPALEAWSARTGFRHVRLDMTPDDLGTSFTFVVNGQPVWVKGANWIPDDVFFHRVDRERYARRISQAVGAGINLLRVWGGGLYESDDFYELCDAAGVMTWQDFAFACAAYTEDEPLRSEVEAEAREHVARLASHPSLVLWNGSNENIWGHEVWGFAKRLDGKSWGLGYYTDLFPSILDEVDGTRPYTPSSPWSGSLDIVQNNPDHGSMHSWELWNREDWPNYRKTAPRFMAEFGWQGPPTWSTLTRAISDAPLTPESPGMLVHQKAMEGNNKLTDGLVAHVPMPDDMDDWHWAMSWNQATAVQTAIEHLRSWAPRTMGSVVWQLNDCWPVVSWAAVDGDERPKPLLYALAHAHADRLVTVQPRGDDLVVAVSNDTAEPWSGEMLVRRVGFDGDELASTTLSVTVGPRETITVLVPGEISTPTDPTAELLVATLGEVRGLWFFTEPRDSALVADPGLEVEVTPRSDGAEVRVRATHLTRSLTLLVDKVLPEAVVDDMLVDLLPGESATFHVAAPGQLDVGKLSAPAVLRSLNQIAHPARRKAEAR
ncbi:MAG: glycoside hydrolase family 2 protein [Propionibacteriaceae bacterium]|jgi:beta-mannosidase|nr:glycoside hydrolase family 2 protein [Propionibacteriaceae bacterium]